MAGELMWLYLPHIPGILLGQHHYLNHKIWHVHKLCGYKTQTGSQHHSSLLFQCFFSQNTPLLWWYFELYLLALKVHLNLLREDNQSLYSGYHSLSLEWWWSQRPLCPKLIWPMLYIPSSPALSWVPTITYFTVSLVHKLYMCTSYLPSSMNIDFLFIE